MHRYMNNDSINMSLLNYVSHALSRLTCLRAFLPCVPSYICDLPALLTRLICAPCVPFSHALFVGLTIFLGWTCSPAETSISKDY